MNEKFLMISILLGLLLSQFVKYEQEIDKVGAQRGAPKCYESESRILNDNSSLVPEVEYVSATSSKVRGAWKRPKTSPLEGALFSGFEAR